jgi:hypothetical protein
LFDQDLDLMHINNDNEDKRIKAVHMPWDKQVAIDLSLGTSALFVYRVLVEFSAPVQKAVFLEQQVCETLNFFSVYQELNL